MMSPESFVKSYENALKSQKWENIAPLISSKVSVTFSDGTVHLGNEEVRKAFQKNFNNIKNNIKNEEYHMDKIVWLTKARNHAVYLFEFYWSGLVNGILTSGSGTGTAVIIDEGNGWQLLTEHLGKKSS